MTPPNTPPPPPQARLDAALRYIHRGWSVVPIPSGEKGPHLQGWPDLRITEADAPSHFSGAGNIGIILGEASGGLVDIDLDCAEAVALAPSFLPHTDLVSGRAGNPHSHRWYVSHGVDYQKYLDLLEADPKRATILEVRGDSGHQTLAYPSVHPDDGDLYQWEDETAAPAPVAGDILCRDAGRLAAAALLAKHWPKVPGKRDDIAMAVCGGLLRAGWTEAQVDSFAVAVATAAGDEEAAKRAKATASAAKLKAGEQVTGWPTVAELLDPKIVDAMREWLGLPDAAQSDAGRATRELRLEAARKHLSELTPASSIDAVGQVLTELAEALAGATPAERAIERERAVVAVEQVECVRSPAKVVDAHLHPPGGPPAPALTGADDPDPSTETQDTGDLLAELVAAIKRYVYLPDHAAVCCGLWVLHTWALDAADYTPRLIVRSPAKRCGKTRLIEVIEAGSRRPLQNDNISAASLFRVVEAESPTLLLDEVDTYLHDREELRGVLNSGYSRTGAVLRTNPNTLQPEKFQTFAPVALASIGALPDTVEDRGFVVALQRKPRAIKVEKFRRAEKSALRSELRPRLARWAADHVPLLAGLEPEIPSALNDRQADVAEPLLAIGLHAGAEWARRAREAVVALAGAADEEQDLGERLLAALKRMFYPRGEDGAAPPPPVERLTLAEIVETLLADQVAGWGEANRGKPVTPAWVARRLRGFGVLSRQWREPSVPGRPRGYYREDLDPVWRQYLPPDPPPPSPPGGNPRDGVTDPQPSSDQHDSDGVTGEASPSDGVTPPDRDTAPVTPSPGDRDAVTRPESRDSPTAAGPVTPSRPGTPGAEERVMCGFPMIPQTASPPLSTETTPDETDDHVERPEGDSSFDFGANAAPTSPEIAMPPPPPPPAPTPGAPPEIAAAKTLHEIVGYYLDRGAADPQAIVDQIIELRDGGVRLPYPWSNAALAERVPLIVSRIRERHASIAYYRQRHHPPEVTP